MSQLEHDLRHRDAIDFRTERVSRIFQQMFLPSVISMISMVVLNITDGAFVGHGVGSDALAAVNIVAPLFMIMNGLGLMFGIGGSVVGSIHLSRGNGKAANINISQALYGGILLSIVLGAIIYLNQQLTCRLFGCNDALMSLACSYLKWIALVMPFNMIGCVGMFIIRLDGSPRFAMLVNLFMAVLNIALDYICIYPLHWGLEGAAIATSTSLTLGNAPVLWYILKRSQSLRLYRLRMTWKSLRLSLRNLGYQIRVGFSGLLGEMAMASMMIVGNKMFLRYLGQDGVAAFSVGCYCMPIVFMLGNSVVQSVQPIISFAYGVGNTQRMAEGRRIAFLAALCSGLAGMLFMWLGASIISVTFLDRECAAYALCVHGMPRFSLAFLFIAINIVWVGYLQSIERAAMATFYTIMRGFVLVIPSFILLPRIMGPDGLWFALPLAEALVMPCMLLNRINKTKIKNDYTNESV